MNVRQYKYRICPSNEALTEECFAKPEHQLEFISDTTVIKFKTGDKRIPNIKVKEGGGIGWMLNPIPMPNFVGSDCDDMAGHPCGGCPCGSRYPGGNDAAGVCIEDVCYGKNPFGHGNMGKNTAIEDEVRVPNLPAGEYVVGFRWGEYIRALETAFRVLLPSSRLRQKNAELFELLSIDCETSSQVWTSCADITIV
eukprot:SAG31_NODE_5479_length_2515_cov_5.563328_2_plen_196_part_00